MENRIIEHKDMRFDPEKHHRRSIRLPGYDYSQSGSYFITICTHNRECLFGEIVNNEMVLNEYGNIVKNCWIETKIIRPGIQLDEFVVMPNHFHGIIVITDEYRKNVGAYCDTPLHENRFHSPSRTIGSIVRGFKSQTTKQINQIRQTPGMPVWQRNYYEHIVRDKMDLHRIRQYIMDNPKNWEMDKNYRRNNL